MNKITTDCRTEVGITVGLVDAIISIARVLAVRDLSLPEVQEAILDLKLDKDVLKLFQHNFKALIIPPIDCRQRLMAEHKPYPRSDCNVCGQFFQNANECDDQLLNLGIKDGR